MRALASIATIVLATYAGLLLLLVLVQGRLVYFPTRALETTPASAGLDFEDVHLATEDGVRLHAWWVPTPDSRGAVLFLHGNYGNISHRIASIQTFQRLGFDVLIPDYRGYGQSQGRPNETGTYRDARAAWRHLTAERGVEPGRVVLFGRSLGGAVAAWLATEERPGAVILESTFTSVAELGADAYPWLPVRALRPFLWVRYETIQRVPGIRAPLLVVHSRGDEIIPVRHGRRLFDAAAEPKRFLELSGGHNDGWVVSAEAYSAGLADFLEEAGFPPR